MIESKEELRQQRFEQAQAMGWQYHGTTAQKGEGLVRKSVLQLAHPDIGGLFLFIGPRGGLKTGRSYRSSACMFWDKVPSPEHVTKAYKKD